ncbi:MAG: Rab family GTPase [Candidatus Hodarchaeota archaeon]
MQMVCKNNHLKIVVVGEGGVGKTALIKTYQAEKPVSDTVMTIAVQFHTKKVQIRGKEVSLQIWDLGGQKQFFGMGVFKRYCQGAHAALVCFDLSDLDTLEEVPKWVKLLPKKAPKILVGTKKDKVEDDSVLDLIELYIKELKFANYVETSSLEDPTSVKVAFEELLSIVPYSKIEQGIIIPTQVLTVN